MGCFLCRLAFGLQIGVWDLQSKIAKEPRKGSVRFATNQTLAAVIGCGAAVTSFEQRQKQDSRVVQWELELRKKTLGTLDDDF